MKTEEIIREAVTAVHNVHDFYALEQVKSKYLGKKGILTDLLKSLGGLDVSIRPQVGAAINLAKEKIIAVIEERYHILQLRELEENLARETIDVTLPSRGMDIGSLHPVTKVQRIVEKFFTDMGFFVAEGPEIESEFYNFTALNIPSHHPARAAHDTFYFDNGLMLRSQTSPVQIRTMQKMKPPIRMICPGRVFRCDSDATHSPMFHQLEMLAIDENVNFANLKWLIIKFIKYFFKDKIEYRFRPSYFPFTEPSAEIDIKWEINGITRWLELGGCGVVHPNVLKAGGIDPDKYSGIAFGFGLERLAMGYYGISDIRMLFESDLQFLKQF